MKAVRIRYSCQWAELNNFADLRERIKRVINTKNATLPSKPKMQKHEKTELKGNVLESGVGPKWIPDKPEYWPEALKGIANTEYIRRTYDAAVSEDFDWDGVGAGGSEVQSKETDVLDYSLSYPQARSLDYCTIPDNY